MIASATQRIRGLLRSIPPDLRFTDLRWSRELLQHFIGDEALIDAAQRIHESLQNALRVRNDLRKFLQRTSTPEYLRSVEYGIYGIFGPLVRCHSSERERPPIFALVRTGIIR